MITLVDIITRRNNCAIFCVQFFFFFLVINVHANRHSSSYSEFILVFCCTVQLLLVILSNTHVICKLFFFEIGKGKFILNVSGGHVLFGDNSRMDVTYRRGKKSG